MEVKNLIFFTGIVFLCLSSHGQTNLGVKWSQVKKENAHLIGFADSKRKDYALFFAVDDYQEVGLPNLKGPITDAEKLSCLLTNYYGVETAIYRNPTREKILEVINEQQHKVFKNENDQLFIFFSGHGKFDVSKDRGAFITAGASNKNSQASMELDTIEEMVTKIPCKHILLAIDACYSGTIRYKGANDPIPFIKKQFENQSRLFLTSGGKERTPDPSKFACALMSALKRAITQGDGLFSYQAMVTALERVTPSPKSGELQGHEGGGFVFIAKEKYRQSARSIEMENTCNVSEERCYSDLAFYEKDGYLIQKSDEKKIPFGRMADGRLWLKQNLNLPLPGAFCDDNETEDCKKYGYLYSWEVAKQACLNLGYGWTLPDLEEWRGLIDAYGGFDPSDRAYRALSKGQEIGFMARLGGIWSNDSFDKAGAVGYYWTDDPLDDSHIKIISFEQLGLTGAVKENILSRKMGISCRCIKKRQ